MWKVRSRTPRLGERGTNTMTERDGGFLDAVLRNSAPRSLEGEAADRVATAAWERVHAAMGTGPGGSGDEFQQRRLDLIADRQTAVRRRRRMARVASVTLAVAVAGAGT